MTPLTLPVDSATLSRLVASLWGDHGDGRGVAREAGVDPRVIGAGVLAGGILTWHTRSGPSDVLPDATMVAADRALSALGDALEDAGLVVDRAAGLRVVGWAAAEEVHGGLAGHCVDIDGGWWHEPGTCVGAPANCSGRCCKLVVTRLVDLEARCPWDERVKAWREGILAAQRARRGTPAPDRKREHGAAMARAQWASVRRAR